MYDSERAIYHDIVTKCYKTFVRERPYPEFSNEWWQGLIADYDAIRKEYAMTNCKELVDKLTFQLQEQHERRQREWKMQQ